MRGRSGVLCILFLVGSMLAGPLVRTAWAFGSAQDQIDSYLAEVDLGLSSEEELALKRKIVADGVIEKVRMGGKAALTEEELAEWKYLTRPVRAKDETNPKGQRQIITVHCYDNRLPVETVRGLFSARGLTIVRKGLEYHWVEAPPGTDARAEGRALEEEGRRLAEELGIRDGLRRELAAPLAATVSTLISDQRPDKGRSKHYIAKNRVGVYFSKPLRAVQVARIAEDAGLVLQWIPTGYDLSDTTWATGEAVFFIPDNATVGVVVDRLFDNPEVRYASPDGWMTLAGYIPARNDPTDPNYRATPSASQWYFLQDRNANGNDSDDDDSRDFDVDAPEGWARQTGSSGTVIAIIDGGFKMDHSDLAGRWWVNPDETPGNGVDDDGNGYVDDINGVDLSTLSGTIPDAHWHGTMVAGIAGAATNNGTYMAGGTWGCSIMALRIDATASVQLRNTQTRLGIQYAQAMGAHVINMSLRMAEPDTALEVAINSAFGSGLVLTASAGNDHEDPSDDRMYPADYANVLEVAGTADDNKRFYVNSGHGSGWGQGEFGPDLCAPAQDMFVLCNGSSGSPCEGQLWADGPDIWGTSLAAPIVAGLAALVMDQYPSVAGDAGAIVRILKGAVDDVDGEVTNETGASSVAHPGPDDLGAGRVNFFKALAPPRVRTVTLIQSADTKFNEGNLNGNSVFNWMDEDIDGDSYSNSDDNNDDGDEAMDGDDVDDDEDGAWDEADTNYVLKQEIEEGELEIRVLFNESMIVDNQGGVDPTVKLILTDGSELAFGSAATGNDDWSTVWVANDFWHGTVTVTEEDISKMYGDLRLTISGTVDMAGDTLDWDLATPGAQGYEYPLHMPGFVASLSDENAGVERNTTSVGESTWPMGWGKLDVMGRGFNTDATDPLSVQSMTIDIERLFADTILISDAAMMLSERDFSYEWDTAGNPEFIDCEYEVTLKAFDGTSGQILTDMEGNIVIDRTVPIMRKILGKLWRPGMRDTTEFYRGEWVAEGLVVEQTEAMPLPGDEMLFEVWMNEPLATEDSLTLQIRGEDPLLELTLEKVDYDSTEFHWKGKLPFTTWDSMRNRMKGEKTIAGYGRDRQGNLFDADPSTNAYRDSTGLWHNYESESLGGGRGQARDFSWYS